MKWTIVNRDEYLSLQLKLDSAKFELGIKERTVDVLKSHSKVLSEENDRLRAMLKEAEGYKAKYADELQKRLELAEAYKKLEEATNEHI